MSISSACIFALKSSEFQSRNDAVGEQVFQTKFAKIGVGMVFFLFYYLHPLQHFLYMAQFLRHTKIFISNLRLLFVFFQFFFEN